MTTKRTKYRVGPFTRTRLHVELVDENGNNVEQPGDIDAITHALEGATARGRIQRWRPHAERLGVAADLLDQAAALIGDDGNVTDHDRFTLLMAQIEITIERAQNEALDIYGKVGRQARAQRDKANIRWAEDAEVIEVIKALATHAEYRDDEPRELWPHLFAKLEEMHLQPDEVGRGTDKAYKYNGGTVTYERFRKAVRRARK